ncbi:LexA family protein [Sporomusa termitida]|uniref:LexA repressor n=1 Tax=Sporomusa termitida TaxID=2377 RepID=A0A517DNF3_9FIRM|nr:S24 family peptidase [Sporomusa termitida]QDR78894.1 LexA repressor [Sporomusa termitida]
MLAAIIKAERTKKGLTQEELSKIVGVTQQAVAKWEAGKAMPDTALIPTLAALFDIPLSRLFGVEETGKLPAIPLNADDQPAFYRVPVIGRIPAGCPVLALESFESYEDIPGSWLSNHPEEFFILRVVGDSMEGARIFDGDKALIRKQSCFDNGQICAVGIAGDEEEYATLKYVYDLDEQFVELVPDNPKYRRKKVARGKVRIYGLLTMTYRQHN